MGDGVSVRLAEVEAYAGVDDPASHAWRGPTPRTEVMFGPPGRLYIYFSYGMHWCANVVCGPDGTASAVLLRAGAVVDGLPLARSRRVGASDRDLARGPARLTRALGLARPDDGADLSSRTPPRLQLGDPLPAELVSAGPRVGIARAADVTWRFWITDDPAVSPYRRHTARHRSAT